MKPTDDKLINMTSSTIGRDLLQAMIDEFKQQPKHWKQLSQLDQEMVIERLSTRIDNLIQRALHIMASKDRTAILGTMDSVTIKSGVKATISISKNSPHILDLYENTGQPLLLIAASHAEFTDGMDTVVGESDQRDLLPDDGDKSVDDQSVIEMLKEAHPDADDTPLDRFLNEAFSESESDAAPDEATPTNESDIIKSATSGAKPNEHGVYTCDPDIILRWKVKEFEVKIELLKLSHGGWIYSIIQNSKTGYSSGPLKEHHQTGCPQALPEMLHEIVETLESRPFIYQLTGPQKASYQEFITSISEVDDAAIMRKLAINAIDEHLQSPIEPTQNTQTISEPDPLYDQAIAIVKNKAKFSISTLQRQLKIGYNRAARISETMLAKGDATQFRNGQFAINPNII